MAPSPPSPPRPRALTSNAMNDIEIVNFSTSPSLVSQYLRELRDVSIQRDPLRFRKNLERIGEIMAYEISKRMSYSQAKVQTPLGFAMCHEPEQPVVIATILRAGLPFHHGFLNFFDHAESAFVSAYRRYKERSDQFDVLVEYMASPKLDGKTLIIVDPMLATGSSMELGYKALLRKGTPARVHICSVIASRQAMEYICEKFPGGMTTVWTAAIDPDINAKSFIVPGLGDAGDLAYGVKDDD